MDSPNSGQFSDGDDAPAIDWSGLLGTPPAIDLAPLAGLHGAKSVLITGAGGSIGSALAAAVLAGQPRTLVLLDHSEHGLYELQSALPVEHAPAGSSCVPILGDICDRALMREIFATYRPQIVYHAAALKHVPIAESNPLAAVRNNALGTYIVAQMASEHRAEQMILVSTDKAVNPQSLMGAAKRLAELVMLGTESATTMKAVRFGNVLGSRGSVVPLFQRQIAMGGPVTVTHPEVRRYFLTLERAVEIVFRVDSPGAAGGIFVPELGAQIKVVDLAHFLIQQAGFAPGKEIAVSFTGLRSGDKMSEDLVSERESLGAELAGGLYKVASPGASEDIGRFMAVLEAALQRRDLVAVLEMICRIVPEYRPSKTLLEHSGAIAARSASS